MGMPYLSVLAGAALALAACGGSQESGQVPVDSPLFSYEAPESMPGEEEDDLFGDDALDDLDEEEAEGVEETSGGAAADSGASNSPASEEGASAPNEEDAAESSGGEGQAEADDAREARSDPGS